MASTEQEQDEKKPWEVADALDEKQIVAEVKGEVIEQYFYEFYDRGKLRIGLSWSGVKFVARSLSERGHPITIEDLKVDYSDPQNFRVIAQAKDLATGEVRFGAAEQPRWTNEKGKDHEGKETVEYRANPFAFALAASKAQRNAIRHFIPELAIQEGYKAWKAQKQAPAATR